MRIRYVARRLDDRWRVYDTSRMCYPYQIPGVGHVVQDVATEDEAAGEANRLNQLVAENPAIGKYL